MTVSKVPKALILFVVLALAGAVVAGCGGGSSTTEATTAEEAAPPAEEEPAEEPAEEEEPAETEEEAGEEEAGGEASLAAEGKSVFTANCGSCHTLKAAGTSGNVGPDLDELEPDLQTVEHQVINGGGGMPAFGKEGTLNPKEIKAVATYVSSVAGQG
ncbi:MAG TPA: cytochrome c [Solirubrobacterales bacterium]|nr:cytochrome c [Solirubrobacterales bacterium]